MRAISCAALGGVCVLSAAAGVFGQASFVTVSTPITGSQTSVVKDMNQAGTALLIEKIIPTGGPAPGSAAYSVARPDGTLTQIYLGPEWAVGYVLSEDGFAYWSTSFQMGGAISRRTGQNSFTEYDQGVPFDGTADERLFVGSFVAPAPAVDTYTAFKWDRFSSTSLTPLAPIAGQPSGFALALSSDGSIIVGQSSHSNSPPAYPTKWTTDQGVALPFPSGKNSAVAIAVADTGDAVGYSWSHPGVARYAATLWPAVGGSRLLPMAPSAIGRAVSISPDGRVIAGYETIAGLETAVIWIDGMRQDLREYLTSRGVPGMSGYSLRQATRVSADGQVIGGHGRTTAGATVAFFATLGPLAPLCAADLGVPGGLPGSDGQLDNNDFIAFIGFFFEQDPRSDMGVSGGLRGSDGAFDNNDFIAFITEFFNGCS